VSKRATSQDVAKLAGVSRTTVSFVLNNVPNVNISEETRQRVLKAARQLGYHPDAAARSLARRRTQILGLVLCQTRDRITQDAFLPEVIRGVNAVASEHDYRVLLESVEDVAAPDAYIGLVQQAHIDGIVLSGPRSDDGQLPHLRELGFPVVLMGQLPEAGLPFVDVDNVRAAQTAVAHLIGLGHQRIACITNAPLEYTAAADRLKGYQMALEAAGLPFDPRLVRYGDFKERSGFEAMQSLLALPERPTAVFVGSDMVAFGALRAARLAGLNVPRDLALVGFDDVPLAQYIDPPLTTVRLPAQRLGAQAAQMLIRMLEQGSDESWLLLETELVIRQSCGAGLRKTT
jgi:DNA-binding LacI/PurR family transcriptional regulator